MPVEVCRADGSHCQPVTAASTAAVAASAEAARLAAQPLDWQFRAIEGYRIAGSTAQPGAGLEAQAIADAAGNARTALARTDLSPGQASLVKTVVERLGNEVIDGKVAPHINDEFRQGLRDLATAPAVAGPAGDRFRGALAQMTRAAQVLDQFELARGTQLGYDVGAGHNTRSAGLPVLAVENIDADLYFKTDDGVVHIESTKYGSNTLAATLKEQAEAKGAPQVERQAAWREQGTVAEPHNLRYFVLDKQADFTGLMNPRNIAELEKAVGDAGARNIVIGDRAYSIDELKQLGARCHGRRESARRCTAPGVGEGGQRRSLVRPARRGERVLQDEHGQPGRGDACAGQELWRCSAAARAAAADAAADRAARRRVRCRGSGCRDFGADRA